MKTFRILFYKPDWDGHLLDNLITGYSQIVNSVGDWKHRDILAKLKCGHTEIWTPNEEGLFVENTDHPNSFLGQCWTSTMRGDVNGACCRPAYTVLDHPNRWYYYEVVTCDEAYQNMIDWMLEQIACNKRYDVLDIMKFFLPVRSQDPNDCQKICSGFVSVAIWVSGDCSGPYTVVRRYNTNHKIENLYSPLLLSLILWKLGCLPYNLDGSLL